MCGSSPGRHACPGPHAPVNSGSRRSLQASMPSRRSRDASQRSMIAEASRASSEPSSIWRMIRFMPCTARGASFLRDAVRATTTREKSSRGVRCVRNPTRRSSEPSSSSPPSRMRAAIPGPSLRT